MKVNLGKLLHLTDAWNLWTGGTKYIPTYVDSVLEHFKSIGYMKSDAPYINFMTASTKEDAIQYAKTLDKFIKVHGKMTLAEYYKLFGYNGSLDYIFGHDINKFCWTTDSKAIISYNPRSREYTICFNTLPVKVFNPGFIDFSSFGTSLKPVNIESRDYTTLYSNNSSICARYCGDINDHIRLYGKITIAQYYLLCDRPDLITKDDYNYGWVRGAYIDYCGPRGYAIRMNEKTIKLGGK